MQRKLTFITQRNDHYIDDSIDVVTDDISLVADMLEKNEVLAIDTENNHLDPFRAVPLLASIAANQEEVFVIDMTCFDFSFLEGYTDKLFLGHNFQYDYKIIKYNGVALRNCWDTMIVEQILGRGSGRRNSLQATHERRLRRPMEEDKGVRNDFLNMGKHSQFTAEHIRYSGYDVFCLFPIREIQQRLIKKFSLQLRIDIGNKCVPILGDMHLHGIYLDPDMWIKRIEEDKKIRYRTEQELDAEIRNIMVEMPEISNSRYTRIRRKAEVTQLGVFGDDVTTVNPNKHNINYSSSSQVLDLFRKIDNNYPTFRDNRTYEEKPSVREAAIEQYIIENPGSKLIDFSRLLLQYKGAEKSLNSFGEIFLHEFYRAPKKGSKLRRGFYNPITGRVHTLYRQETTANGRLASGEDKKRTGKEDNMESIKNQLGVFNSQQMVKENRFRTCFRLTQEEIDDGYFISTIDLSGAELIILGALSGDTKLIKLQAEDIHSYLATKAFNGIIEYLFDVYADGNMSKERLEMELYDILKVNKIYKSKTYCNILHNKKGEQIGKCTHPLAGQALDDHDVDRLTKARVRSVFKHRKFIVNKKHSKDIRDPFKNVVYGSIYGAQGAKVASTLNIAGMYGDMVMSSMERELPHAFGFLKDNARNAIKNGYVIFNKRTNSRHWFKDILDAKQYNHPISNTVKGRVERQAKNLPISGTQADMIKESMIDIDKWIHDNNVDCTFLLQVHDELVFKHKPKMIGETHLKPMMEEAANRYLNGIIEMNADCDTYHWWYKG